VTGGLLISLTAGGALRWKSLNVTDTIFALITAYAASDSPGGLGIYLSSQYLAIGLSGGADASEGVFVNKNE